ncbi:MAG: DUF167 domain-containing protein [Chloroflexi bacterium]|nr:DUF167 domain-containing protein [Chloroflexota bacterium]
MSSHARGSALLVTVVPRAGRTSIEEAMDGTLRVRVAAPPVGGAANAALLRFLAGVLDVPRSRLAIASGTSNRHKRVVVEGMTPGELQKRLRDAPGQGR